MSARKRTKQKRPTTRQAPAREPVKTFNDSLPMFKQQLREHAEAQGSGAPTAFETLVRAECSADWLMCAVRALSLSYEYEREVHSDPARMTARRLRSLTEKTLWVTQEWERELQSPSGKAVAERASMGEPFGGEIEYHRSLQIVRSLAVEAKNVHRGSRWNRRPLYDDTLAALTEGVKLRTGDYRDPQVSQLVWFATGQRYDENTLRVWRHDHPQALERARLRFSGN